MPETSAPNLQALTDDDRIYAGSRYSDVVAALLANPYQRVWGAPGEPALPEYEVTFRNVFGGLIAFGTSNLFGQASARTIDAASDLRWGPDRKGNRRLVHPNGVCLFGTWHISETTPYSGFFSQGSTALIVGRYSTCCTETKRGQLRSLSMVGKLFPTTDPNHAQPLRTANFFTQDDIGGADTEYINDIELRNAPDTTLSRRGLTGMPLLTKVGTTFNKIDQRPSMRQVYQIAELGKPSGTPTKSPDFMRLLVAAGQPRLAGTGLDFRDEVMGQIFERGDATPKRTLTFDIEVTDDGVTSGPAFKERRTFQNWKRIGTITFNNAVVSYNGDFVIHFNHPTWRTDRNDPSTATRVSGKKVRE